MNKINALVIGCNIRNELLEKRFDVINLTVLGHPQEVNTDQFNETDVLVWTNTLSLSYETVKKFTKLKYIINWGTNSTNIDPRIVSDKKFKLLKVNDYATQAVSDFGIARFFELIDGREIKDLKIGVVGLGKIGFSIASKLKAIGVKNIAYAASRDKRLSGYRFVKAEELFNSSDFVFITTGAPEPIDITKVNNSKLKIINLSLNKLFSTPSLDKLLLENKIAYYFADSKPIRLKSPNHKFSGHIAYRSPQSIINKHNKLLYFIDQIICGRGQTKYIYLVRHGETINNHSEVYQGQEDSELTQLGVQQMQNVAIFLSQRDVNKILCSPLGRSRNSAAIIGDVLGVKPEVYEFLVEQHFGKLQGLEKKQAKTEYKKFFTARSITAENKLFTPYPGIKGESYFDIYSRVHDELMEILANLTGNTVIVGHESVNRILKGIALNKEPLEVVNNRQRNNEIIEIDLSTVAERVISV